MSNIFKNNLLKILIILLTISSSSYALKKEDIKTQMENTKDTIIKSSLTEEKQTTLNDKYINLFNELNQKKE